MFTTRKRGRTAAVFGAVAGLLLTTAAAASAATEAPIPTIDPNERGEITITKLLQPEGVGVEAPGTQVTGHGATPIEGVTFQVERIIGFDFDGLNGVIPDELIDLTTAQGWQNAAKLTPALLKEYPTRVQKAAVVGPKATGSNGEVTFDDLDLGLYLVTEVSTDDAMIEGELVSESGDAVVPSSKPFLVTVPMTNPDPVPNPDPDFENTLSEWMYHVYVYPKNERVSLEKSVQDAEDTVVGDIITYQVSMDVPEGTTSFIITDELDSRLRLLLNSVALIGDPTGVVDYDGASNVLKVTFTAPDGQTLPVGQVGFTFDAEVLRTGVIDNDATYEMTVNGVDVQGESNDVLTKWGGHDVAKVDENGAYLEGAVFSLYEVRFDASGNEIVTLIAPAIESDQYGTVMVDGLRYSRWADGAPIVDTNQDGEVTDEAGYVLYRLIEIKAPDKHELQPAPIDFEVSGPLDRDGDDGIDLKIINVPHNAGFELPAVGGNRAVLPILAAVIAAGGVVWLIRSRREQKA